MEGRRWSSEYICGWAFFLLWQINGCKDTILSYCTYSHLALKHKAQVTPHTHISQSHLSCRRRNSIQSRRARSQLPAAHPQPSTNASQHVSPRNDIPLRNIADPPRSPPHPPSSAIATLPEVTHPSNTLFNTLRRSSSTSTALPTSCPPMPSPFLPPCPLPFPPRARRRGR